MEKLSSAQKTALGDFFSQWILSSSFSAVKCEMQLENAKLTTICAVGSPYGKMNELVVSSASNNNDVTQKFTGHELDKGTNLTYAGARLLDSDLGVWTSPDAAREFHWSYSYVGGNPINLFDPDGNKSRAYTSTGFGPRGGSPYRYHSHAQRMSSSPTAIRDLGNFMAGTGVFMGGMILGPILGPQLLGGLSKLGYTAYGSAATYTSTVTTLATKYTATTAGTSMGVGFLAELAGVSDYTGAFVSNLPVLNFFSSFHDFGSNVAKAVSTNLTVQSVPEAPSLGNFENKGLDSYRLNTDI